MTTEDQGCGFAANWAGGDSASVNWLYTNCAAENKFRWLGTTV